MTVAAVREVRNWQILLQNSVAVSREA
jgi:hypothetical protein